MRYPTLLIAPAHALTFGLGAAVAQAATLPVPCVAGSCGPNAPAGWVSSGQASLVQHGNQETITQTSQNATLNWSSFNISSDGVVTFKQPTNAAVALNQIFQSDPSKILGALSSNGTLYLINQNGILFGSGSQVNVGSLLASTLNLTPQTANGLLQAAQQGAPALAAFTDANGNPLPSGSVVVESGATVQAPGGQIMMFAPQVTNAGTLRADGGQVLLAAGDSIYLAPSTDPNLRGLLVEVGKGGTVTNAAATVAGGAPGEIAAKDGDVTLMGLIVNQLGRVSASTAVRANGSVHLLAQDGGSAAPGIGAATLSASHAGTLTLGAGSETEVLLDSGDPAAAVDATPQPHSTVVLSGAQVTLAAHASVVAPSGSVSIEAQTTPGELSADFSPTPGTGRLLIDSGASIDVSGDNISLPMQSNVLAVQLRSAELANSPLQRNGPLRGQTVYVDIRQTGALANGTPWQGSPIGDLSGYLGTVAKGVGQRNLGGGSISLVSDGAVFVASDATLNLSGGSIQYLPGLVNTTKVRGTNGQIYDISQALPTQSYTGIVSGYTWSDAKWGVTQVFPTFTTLQPGYVQGFDAGQLSLAAPRLVLDGNVVANTIAGPYQRNLPGAIPAGALYRPVNQLPLGASLILGVQPATAALPNFLLPDVEFASGTVLNQLLGPTGAPFDPLNDPLPQSLDTVRLRPELFGAGAFGSLQLLANGHVSVPADVTVQLPAGGSFAITAGSIDVEGRISSPSGSVTLAAAPSVGLFPGSPDVTLTLGSHAALDVSGRWVNDLRDLAAGNALAPLAIGGGTVALAAGGGTPLTLASGSLIDVSGGAQLTTRGTLLAGAGGSVSLSESPTVNLTPVAATLDSTLRGFALQQGGSLAITANTVCIAAADCRAGDDSAVWFAPSAFSSDGFRRISLATNLGGLQVAPGTIISAQQHNYQPSGHLDFIPTGTRMESFAPAGLLPDASRAPMSVSLTVNPVGPRTLPGTPFDHTTFGSAGVLEVGAGAVLSVDAGGSFSMSSATSLIESGTLLAPGGSISLATTVKLPLAEFIPNQGIWIEDGALLSTHGTAIVTPNDQGLETGTVFGGGSLSVIANRGYLITGQHSLLDASGTSAALDIRPVGSNGPKPPVRTVVASSGGTVSLAASDGMLLNGGIVARPGDGPGAAGGTLAITLDGNLYGGELASSGTPLLPLNSAQLVIGNSAPVVVAPQSAIPGNYTAVGMIPVGLIKQGGFGALSLTAADLYDSLAPTGFNAPAALGSINFSQDTALALPASLRLNAPQVLVSSGAAVDLSSAYVGLGYDDARQGAQAPVTVTPGTGALRVSGDLIELVGTLGLMGADSTELRSSGDIRFRGVQTIAPTILPLAGGLAAAGSVTLSAAQLYPTTLSQYAVSVSGCDPSHCANAPLNTLSIRSGEAAKPGPVLSAGGQLTLQADTIEQDGVLRAPFGQLKLLGQSITLDAGSVTSVAGAGQIVPFGATQAGADWVYGMPLGQTAIYTHAGVPQKTISLQADKLRIAQGAGIDLSGGGDLQAFEFIPGVGGTVDVLANSYNPSAFAIVPGLGLAFAPFDPQTQPGFGYGVGSSVVLGGGGPVAAGEYALLPARYALLPGAYLVQPVSGFTDLASGTAVPQPDGTRVVAGQFAQTGTAFLSPRTQGFDIIPAAVVQTEAQYNLTSANTFFPQLAAGAGPKGTSAALPQLPRDAGNLQLLAGSQLEFLGTLSSGAATGGRGGAVDISANQLEITSAGGGSGLQPGAVLLSATQLNALGAQSLLIGGIRSSTAQGAEQINVAAASVSVDPNVQLTGSELLLTASDTVAVGAGASLTATGSAAPAPTEFDLNVPTGLTGGGALLRVSTGAQAPVVRLSTANTPGGDLTIASGAVLASTHSVTLQASNNLLSQAIYKVPGGSLAFTASQIALGTPSSSTSGLVLLPSLLTALNLSDLSLTSASSIDVFGSNTLQVGGKLSLQAGVIESATSDAALTVKATQLALGGLAAPPTAAPVTSSGALLAQADLLTLTGGTLQLAGFSGATLNAATALSMKGAGALSSDAPLGIQTALVSSAPGTDFRLSSLGAVQITGAPAVGKTPPPPAGAGGQLAVSGSSVLVDTTVRLPSGVLQLSSTGVDAADGVTIGSSANLVLAGQTVTYDNLPVAGPGGRLLASSAAGAVAVASGASIDLSAGGTGAAAGEMVLSAPQGAVSLLGTLRATSSDPAAGGQVLLDAQSLPALGALSTLLGAGGFTGSVDLRQRGSGDLVLPTSSTLTAHQVTLSADAGSVDILGQIVASGFSGGSVRLAAQNAIDVEGTVRVDAAGQGQSGGNVQLWSSSGNLVIGAPATVDLAGGAGGAGGTLSIRVPRTSLTALTGGTSAPVSLAGSIQGASRLVAEGVATYVEPGSSLSASELSADPSNPRYADAANFMSNAASIATALAGTSGLSVSVVPGIEIQSAGDLVLPSAWDLSQWSFGGQAGVLTLRAAGNLTFQGSLSDGFAGASSFVLPTTPGTSWSYRLIGGADLSASNVMSVLPAAQLGGGGNIAIAPGQLDTYRNPPQPVMIRTGTGSIDIAAGNDLIFGNRASVIYTAGENSGLGIPLAPLANLPYPTGGGDININVGGDIIGAASNQLVTNWLWRTGSNGSARATSTGWTVNFPWFEENVGALAGGNVSIAAGGSIRELSVAIPTIGIQVGGTQPAQNALLMAGGGNLSVQAGGSITGGSYFVGHGTGRVTAWDVIGADLSGAPYATGIAPIIALGDSNVTVTARGSLVLEGAVNPFLLPQGTAEPLNASSQSSFSTYGPTSAAALMSIGGDVTLLNDEGMSGGLETQLTSMRFSGGDGGMYIYPGTLNVAALAGNVYLDGSTEVLWPSHSGNLDLLAQRGVEFAPGERLLMSDVEPATLPNPNAPVQRLDTLFLSIFSAPPPGFSRTPVHSADFGAGAEDPQPARIVALTGNVDNADLAYIPKPVHIVAGQDITGLALQAESLSASDVSVIAAGRDFAYDFPRDIFGNIVSTSTLGVIIEGAGSMLVEAGRNVNLGSASGLTSAGNLFNPALPSRGADIAVLAGATLANADVAGFTNHYLVSSSAYDALLVSYVAARSSLPVTTKGQALAAFNTLSLAQQFELCERIMYSELRSGGRSAAAPGPGHDDYARAFLALETLFPGSTAANASSQYGGSLSLYFSRIYTLAGGDISLAVPGGGINAGLATPPAAFGLSKAPAELGIVAQDQGNVSSASGGDFQVNQSRVFAADGGDILVWSTHGNIDAGRGAKTAISAPPPTTTFDQNGHLVTVFPAALTGSGIQALATTLGVSPGDVDLYAPHGVVNANDAGIVAGNLTIGATAVLGRDNITVSGVAVGVPVESSGLGASLAGSSSVASSASTAAAMGLNGGQSEQREAPQSEAALSWLDVFLLGFGEEQCKAADLECLKRQAPK